MTAALWTPSRRLLLAGAMSLPAAHAFADDPVLVRAVEIAPGQGTTRLSVRLSDHAAPRGFFLSGPDRFVIDIPNARFAAAQAGQGTGAGVVQRYRYAVQPNGTARLVLDLSAPARLGRQEISARRDPGFSFELTHGPMTLAAATSPAAAPAPARGRRRVIVIDPGHGGRDPGALGVTGVREKDVVLDTALNLRQALESRGRYEVALTRDADLFIPLPERVRFAREQGADLFLSLHADANANAEAAGASVYTLSERGAARGRTVMDQQDWTLDFGDAPRNGLVTQILTDLTQRETSNRSVVFADSLIEGLESANTPLLRNTHRNGGFFVLLAPDVPAALLEMGFLTNAADERRLADARTRQRMAEAVAVSIDHYFAPARTYMARA